MLPPGVPFGSSSPRNSKNASVQIAALNYQQTQTENTLRHAQIMDMYEKQHSRNMMGLYMQGAGTLLQAYGASQPTLEEKRDERSMKWKPSGGERDVVNTARYQYPELAEQYKSGLFNDDTA